MLLTVVIVALKEDAKRMGDSTQPINAMGCYEGQRHHPDSVMNPCRLIEKD
jgi:hypothetical protein